MVDSSIVLWGQTIAYSFYCIVIILVMGWFALRVTRGKSNVVKPGLFYTFVGFLIVLGYLYTLLLTTPSRGHR